MKEQSTLDRPHSFDSLSIDEMISKQNDYPIESEEGQYIIALIYAQSFINGEIE